MATEEEDLLVHDDGLPRIVQLGLISLGLIGGLIVWQWWGHPVRGVAIASCVIGGFLVVLSTWGFVLPRRG
jgi:hypothetical protein